MDEMNRNDLPTADSSAEERRSERVKNFKLEFSVDDIPDVEPSADAPVEESVDEELPAEQPTAAEQDDAPSKEKKPKNATNLDKKIGCLKRVVYAMFILLISGILASFLTVFVLDSMAINRSDKAVDIEIPAGATTRQIADLLAEKGLIDQPLCFRIFSKLARADGTYQVGFFTLTQDMGYAAIVEQLQTMTPKETVTVTLTEGLTVDEMATLLEKNGVCDKSSFYEAVAYGAFDYDFVKDIPTAEDGEQYSGRIYRLEGYLFPDTYNFYLGSSGETVVGTMLENFNTKLTQELRNEIAAKGWTIDQAVIMASLVEGEAAKKDDMEKVSKVLENRLAPNSGYPKLELDSTRDYVSELIPSVPGLEVTGIAYNTYERQGLPVGAINNPGLQALIAALRPSQDAEVAKCYFFATDYDTGTTYFSKTLKEHEAICRKYGIGMYG